MPEFHAAARTIHIWVDCAAIWGAVDVQTQDVNRDHVWIVNQMTLVSVLKFKTLVTTKGHVTAMGLGCLQGPFWSPKTMPMLSPCHSEKTVQSAKPMVTSGPNLLLMAMVWVHGPATVSVCVDVFCYFMTGAHANHLLNNEKKKKRHPQHPCILVVWGEISTNHTKKLIPLF